MISQDIKLLIEQLDEYGQEQPGFLKKHKGKLALGALSLAGTYGYNANTEFANDVDTAGQAIIKPGMKLLRNAGIIKDESATTKVSDAIDLINAKIRENSRNDK